jgi:peptidoglycan/LPS O-acetylase OafA/YrhL
MVAIFFAISGYVLCRHILKAIKERRIEAAYKSLASAVLRRAFRLYIPPLITMFIVAVLAQLGGFRSEKDIFTGPDSKWINGTVTYGYARRPCTNVTKALDTTMDMAQYLDLRSSAYLLNVTGKYVSEWDPVYHFCLNDSSRLFGPPSSYGLLNSTEQEWWRVAMGLEADVPEVKLSQTDEKLKDELETMEDVEGPETKAEMTERLKPFVPLYDHWVWVQLGGNWEEHPIIHNKTIWAIGNYSLVMAEWANPLYFGHYHTRYDTHTFTIPMEFRGSMVNYIFLVGTAALQARWRLGFGAFLSAFALLIGRWDISIFVGGMLHSELDLRYARMPGHARAPSIGRLTSLWKTFYKTRFFRWCCTFLALYFLSYPDAAAEFTPGFMFLSRWKPKYYHQSNGWMYYEALGALILLPCILRSSFLRGLLDMRIPQWLGKVSFSFYLIHGPVLHSLGFWIMPRLFERFGWMPGLLVGYVVLLSVALYLASWFHEKVDVWSMTIGRRIEKYVVE